MIEAQVLHRLKSIPSSRTKNKAPLNPCGISIKASPKPDTDQAKEAGGAYINCWINFPIKDGAECLAQLYVEKIGWQPEETQDARWVAKGDYENEPESLQFFSEAEADGASIVIHEWPINGTDDDE